MISWTYRRDYQSHIHILIDHTWHLCWRRTHVDASKVKLSCMRGFCRSQNNCNFMQLARLFALVGYKGHWMCSMHNRGGRAGGLAGSWLAWTECRNKFDMFLIAQTHWEIISFTCSCQHHSIKWTDQLRHGFAARRSSGDTIGPRT